MARQLSVFEWAVVAVLVILVSLVIYLLRPLILAIAIIAVGYLIYRWYTSKRLIRLS